MINMIYIASYHEGVMSLRTNQKINRDFPSARLRLDSHV